MRCGWCRGEPKCIDKVVAYQCPICSKMYPKPEGGKDIVELFEHEKKEFIPKPRPPVEPKKRGRPRLLPAILKKNTGTGKRGRPRNPFKFVEQVMKGLTTKQVEWMKSEEERNYKCPKCKSSLEIMSPRWMHDGKEWQHDC